jgi:hypothetical protein
MLMQEGNDYFVKGIHVENSKELVVLSHFLSHSKLWPKTIGYKEKTYVYTGIRPLPSCYTSDYFSMALYYEQDASNVDVLETVYG